LQTLWEVQLTILDIQQFATAATAAEKIFAILDRPSPTIDIYSESGDPLSTQTLQQDIILRNVSFSYPSRPTVPVLTDTSMQISHGALTGIVGESGGGKSTIASLLMRTYDPSTGSICFMNKDIRYFNIAEWRKHIAYVPQDPILFTGTILDNIAFGINTAHMPEDDRISLCLKAASEAHCDFLDNLPNGIETTVGSPRIARLSGK